MYLDQWLNGQNAVANLCEFLDVEDLDDTVLNAGNEQRLTMVAANFRKEVTATGVSGYAFNLIFDDRVAVPAHCQAGGSVFGPALESESAVEVPGRRLGRSQERSPNESSAHAIFRKPAPSAIELL